jgi:serine/threonine protein kinase
MPLAVMQRSTSPRGPIALSKDDEDAKPKAQGGTALVQHPTHLKEGPPRLPQVVGLQYRVLQRLGEGSFGIIHVGQCTLTRKFVAIKFESAAPTNRLFDDSDRNNISGQQQRQLPDEYRNYQTLNSASSDGCPWFPMTYFFGVQDGCWALVMDLEGPSLETLFERHHRLLPMGIVARLAVQMVSFPLPAFILSPLTHVSCPYGHVHIYGWVDHADGGRASRWPGLSGREAGQLSA